MPKQSKKSQPPKWFTNIHSDLFTYEWDSETYEFKPGQSELLTGHLADHFTKHLVDKILHLKGKQVTDASRLDLESRCLAVPEGEEVESLETVSEAKTEVAVLKKKQARAKRKQEDFEGLKDETVSVKGKKA